MVVPVGAEEVVVLEVVVVGLVGVVVGGLVGVVDEEGL